ncbi:hypothetical protein [Devosia sp. Root635]|uniref:hypothetical protein n=1 Tax=Devosia sp. Root635 TaxID=1736575 RepID=UPI0006FADA46|nr:hypothetical protein [Devosia sp. Root635]KRA44676.1 hypothetical protein ASD80_05915 [Devosia sp. Root635]
MMTVDNVTIDPTAIFGMLLAAEGGASLDQMAHVYGLARHSVLDLLTKARRGECGKVEAWSGEGRGQTVSGKAKGAGPVAADRQEVLLQRWMRRIARHMHRHGEISLEQVRQLVDTQSETASVWMDQLRHQFKKLGLAFRSETRGTKFDLFYVIEGDSRDLLATIIADDWKIEVER